MNQIFNRLGILPDSDRSENALASRVRRDQPDIIVILAGNVEAATRKAGDLCDDEPSVAKPYDHQLVLGRIRRAAAARERNDPKAAKE